MEGRPTRTVWEVWEGDRVSIRIEDFFTDDELYDLLDIRYLLLDQTTVQTIINGVPLMTTPVDEYGSGDQLVNKDYIDGGTWLLPPIVEWYDPTVGLPADPEVGDRYGADGSGSGWIDGYIYEWDGESWVESEPEEGWMVWALFELILYVFFSGGWMEAGGDAYVLKSGDTMTGTLSFTDTYYPSPASDEPAIRANRDIVIKSGHKLIFDGA